MKIHVLGKGLAAMGFLEALLQKVPSIDNKVVVQWIGPSFEDKGWRNCSRNSTAVVALHGIRRGVSPLGDDLVTAYEEALSFFNENTPEGVERCQRIHFAGDDTQKLSNRFGKVENLVVRSKEILGVQEEALIYRPTDFMSWWFRHLKAKFEAANIQLDVQDDVLLSIEENALNCIGDNYSLADQDLVIDCRGSSVNELGSADLKIKKAPGHYLVWENKELKNNLGCNSWVYTLNGHNLIYHAGVGRLILGGSTEDTDVEAKSFIDLENQKNAFLEVLPEFENILQVKNSIIQTGMRPKGPKRRPFVQRNGQIIAINGFYKNGYSLCYLYGKKAVELIL